MTTTLLGMGVYDAEEVSYLLSLPVESIVRWSLPRQKGLPPIVPPSFDRAFAFVDLVSLTIVGQLWSRRVAENDLRHGIRYLCEMTGHEKPLAHRDVVAKLATSGQALIAEVDDGWFDIGKGGQGAFKEVVRVYLKKIVFNERGVAQLWKPAPHIVLDPRVQAGTPCLEGTRIPTSTVADLARVDPETLVAEDLDIDIELIRAAVSFEDQLLAGQGIAA
jgi:uncharacterized protein (DUF433 family)